MKTDESPSIIFNYDTYGVLESSQSSEEYLRRIFDPLQESQVETLFWNEGADNTASWDSEVLELTGQRSGKVMPLVQQLIEQGKDLPKMVVEEARQRDIEIFFSFRLNDTHDAWGWQDNAEFPTFKAEHPEWLIGPGFANCTWTSLNFAIPEVRQLKFDVIREIFGRYDFDGLELDFLRGPPFFVPGTEPHNCHILTQWVRQIRHYLNQRAAERGRPIKLAAHVDENLEACRLDGFDVATWVREDLVDILTLGSGTIDIDVGHFKLLAEGTGVLVYPCLYGWPSKYNPIPAELARGIAANYRYQGADGIYTFNWFLNDLDNVRYQIPLLREIGDPEATVFKPMMFAADRGQPDTCYSHNWMQAALPATVAEDEVIEVPILIGEDFATSAYQQRGLQLALRVECDGLSEQDTLRVAVNERVVPTQRSDEQTVEARLAPSDLRQGPNQVKLHLARRAGSAFGIEGEVTVTAVEIHADYYD